MELKGTIIEPHYLPSLEYFTALSACDSVYFEVHEHYVKQSPRTRATILTSAGPKTLVVPVVHGGLGRMPLWQVEIDYSTRWWQNHWRTIESAYRNAPWFEHYGPDLQKILFSREKQLVGLNLRILRLCQEILHWKAEIIETSAYFSTNLHKDLRNQIIDKTGYQSRNFYRPVPYNQVFGGTFVPNMSVLDAIFCCGPETGRIIANSCAAKENVGD